jgi:hypothetical protein
VRADLAIRRHWQLVYCAFSFCWWVEAHGPPTTWELPGVVGQPAPAEPERADHAGAARGAPGKKSHAARLDAGLRSWPVALRHVRAWLEPGLMLWRYWQTWSIKPPPPALQRLLDWLWEGRGIDLYIR